MTDSTLTEPSISSNNERCNADVTAFLDAYDNETTHTETFDIADAFAVAEDFVDMAIAALRRDERWANVRREELELLLADVRGQFAQILFAGLDGFASSSELRHAAAEAFEAVTAVDAIIEQSDTNSTNSTNRGAP